LIEWILGVVAAGVVSEIFGSENNKPSSRRHRFPPRKIVPLSQAAEPAPAPAPIVCAPVQLPAKIPAAQSPRPLFLSTSKLGRVLGIKGKPLLFDELIQVGLIVKPNREFELTEHGNNYGIHLKAKDGGHFVAWNPTLIRDRLIHLKEELLSRCNFRLFHMTHIRNLRSIVELGLFCHDKAPEYLDISNAKVNARRSRAEPIHNRPLHDYVPLYFNPRNAMLFQKQCEFLDRVVLIEVRPEACLSDFSIFSEKNAAANDCKFAYCLSDVEKFRWDRIRAENWSSGGITNIDSKQLMMSECLISEHIDTTQFSAIHTANDRTASEVRAMLHGSRHPDIHTSGHLFFPPRVRHDHISDGPLLNERVIQA